ncbi:hypothetical protein GQ56_0105175 [Burkholderia paludis]|nr:hypothetical protein GQ56_0105175 [Burkholderia paludis]
MPIAIEPSTAVVAPLPMAICPPVTPSVPTVPPFSALVPSAMLLNVPLPAAPVFAAFPMAMVDVEPAVALAPIASALIPVAPLLA